MYRYVLKRLLFLVPTILGVTLIIFLVMNLTPSTPGRIMLGSSATIEDVEQLNEELGYNQPILKRYVDYVVDMVANQDFGTSYYTKQPVFNEIWPRYIVTIKLALIGVLLSTLIGVPLGILAAVKQYSLLDSIPSLFAFFIAAVPSFVLGMVFMFIFCQKLGWLPTYDDGTLVALLMPALTIAIAPAAQNFRFTKSSMLEEIRQDYVRTARAKGASERTVIWKHALQNALLPVVTNIGMNLGVLIAGAVVAEKLFSIQGIGSLIVDRIGYKDEPTIVAGTILIAIVFTVVMLLVDIAYAYIDPRIKAKYERLKG